MNKLYLILALGLSVKADGHDCVETDYMCGDSGCVADQQYYADVYGLTAIQPWSYYVEYSYNASYGLANGSSDYDFFAQVWTATYGFLFCGDAFEGDNLDYCTTLITEAVSYGSFADTMAYMQDNCQALDDLIAAQFAAYGEYSDDPYDYACYSLDYLFDKAATLADESMNSSGRRLLTSPGQFSNLLSGNHAKYSIHHPSDKLKANGYAESYSVGLTWYEDDAMSCYHEHVSPFAVSDVWDWNSDY